MPQQVKAVTTNQLLCLFLGTLSGCAIVVFSYVALTNASIVPNDEATWPHMAPERFYYFIPVFAILAFAFGALVELLFFQKRGFHLRWSIAWVMLGLAYSAIWLFYCLALLFGPRLYLLPLSYVAAIV